MAKKKCFNCKKKLTIVDDVIDKCAGCHKRYCLHCVTREKHKCTNEHKPVIQIYQAVVPKKVDII